MRKLGLFREKTNSEFQVAQFNSNSQLNHIVMALDKCNFCEFCPFFLPVKQGYFMLGIVSQCCNKK